MSYYSCEWHPRYQGKGKPRGNCSTCWLMWLEEHPDTELKSKDVRDILLSALSRIESNSQSLRRRSDYYF